MVTNSTQQTDNALMQRTVIYAINRLLNMFDRDDPYINTQLEVINKVLRTMHEHLDQPK